MFWEHFLSREHWLGNTAVEDKTLIWEYAEGYIFYLYVMGCKRFRIEPLHYGVLY